MKHLFLFSAILLSLVAVGQDDIVKVGQRIPTFNITLGNGQTISSSSLDQKVILINFFATWCGPCLAELPVLEDRVWKKYKADPNFSLLVIGRDHSDSVVQAFKTKYHFDLPMYPDKGKEIYSLFAAKYIPRNYIIDKSGKIVYASMGFEQKEFEKMLAILDELLK